MEAAKLWVPRARAVADIVIAVTHVGVEDDRRLARLTRGIDAIIGGDSHTYLYQPVVERNLDGADVPIVQDGEFGVRLGEFHLTFEGDAASGWRLARYADDLIAVDETIAPDPKIAGLVERFARPLDVAVGTVAAVGTTPAERGRMTAEGLARAWKAATGAEIGLQPQGALFESFRRHAVTRFEVHAILPFHDTLWRGQMTGAQIRALIDHPSIIGGVMRATVAEADIDPARTYTVGSLTYVAQNLIGPGGADTGLDARKTAEDWLAAGGK